MQIPGLQVSLADTAQWGVLAWIVLPSALCVGATCAAWHAIFAWCVKWGANWGASLGPECADRTRRTFHSPDFVCVPTMLTDSSLTGGLCDGRLTSYTSQAGDSRSLFTLLLQTHPPPLSTRQATERTNHHTPHRHRCTAPQVGCGGVLRSELPCIREAAAGLARERFSPPSPVHRVAPRHLGVRLQKALCVCAPPSSGVSEPVSSLAARHCWKSDWQAHTPAGRRRFLSLRRSTLLGPAGVVQFRLLGAPANHRRGDLRTGRRRLRFRRPLLRVAVQPQNGLTAMMIGPAAAPRGAPTAGGSVPGVSCE